MVIPEYDEYEGRRHDKPKREASLAAPNGYAAVLEEVFQWLGKGPMDDWDERCRLHRKIGKMLGKKPTLYHE